MFSESTSNKATRLVLKTLLPAAFVLVCLSACKDDTVTDPGPGPVHSATPADLNLPYNFPDMEIPEYNRPTVEAIALGRELFYDPILHPLEAMSCASCHDQSASFTTHESNALALVNLGWNDRFLWNGKVAGTLEDITRFEVEEFFQTDVDALNAHPDYREKFKAAYGVSTITTHELSLALAQFFRTLNSHDSKYDRWLRGEVQFTAEEYAGFEIFNSETGDCFHCHGTILFHDNSFGNNGLDLEPDPGLFEVTGDPNDFGKFKTPTLRNIELTAPYMHDGRFETLEEVVDFYSSGVQHHSPNLSPLMKYSANGGVQMYPLQKEYLIAFLKTLTDTSFTEDERFSDPR